MESLAKGVGSEHSAFIDMMQGNMIDLFYNELANKIIDGLDKLYHKYEKGAAERWIWELLQNAKDCCAGTQ
jgi:hypothetical protein